MGILFVSNELCMDHYPGERHPERPDRLSAVIAGLKATEIQCEIIEVLAEPLDEEKIFHIHNLYIFVGILVHS